MVIKDIVDSLACLWEQKQNIFTLVIGDFKQSYLSSYLGFLWAIIGPLVMLIVLTVVFQLGFRTPVTDDTSIPFAVWLTCGMLPWLYFADGINAGAQSITAYAFLVRKATFRISFLPMICLLSKGLIHLAMMVFLLVLLGYHAIYPSIYWIQWFYYASLLYLFLLGVTLISSALAVFIPDVVSFLGIIVNIGFWATPIFWSPIMLPSHLHWLFHINPIYYIIHGYRDTFLHERWFWDRPMIEHGLFFTFLTFFFLLGTFVFRKLRPHFADVL